MDTQQLTPDDTDPEVMDTTEADNDDAHPQRPTHVPENSGMPNLAAFEPTLF